MPLKEVSRISHSEYSSNATLGVNLKHRVKAWTAHLLEAKQGGYAITKMTPDEVIHIQNMEPVSRKPVTLELASILLAGESRFKKKFTAVALSANEIMLYREKSSSAALLTAKKEGEEATGVSGSTEVKSRMKGNLGFPETLLPKSEALKKIVIDLQLGSTKKDFNTGWAFAILAVDFMTNSQQEAYKKLGIEGRKSYLEYVGNNYIKELSEDFGISGKIYESGGLPELEFFDPYKRGII